MPQKIPFEIRLQRKIVRQQKQIKKLRAALKPFAEYFEGDLFELGGGTSVAPAFPLQVFKDAKAALK